MKFSQVLLMLLIGTSIGFTMEGNQNNKKEHYKVASSYYGYIPLNGHRYILSKEILKANSVNKNKIKRNNSPTNNNISNNNNTDEDIVYRISKNDLPSSIESKEKYEYDEELYCTYSKRNPMPKDGKEKNYCYAPLFYQHDKYDHKNDASYYIKRPIKQYHKADSNCTII